MKRTSMASIFVLSLVLTTVWNVQQTDALVIGYAGCYAGKIFEKLLQKMFKKFGKKGQKNP